VKSNVPVQNSQRLLEVPEAMKPQWLKDLMARVDTARRQRVGRRGKRARPQVETLEARRLPAAVIGNILKETFDDTGSLPAFVQVGNDPDLVVQGSSFDDIGRITTVDPVTGNVTYQATHPVFHHEVAGSRDISLRQGGSTVPTAPQDSANFFRFIKGTDTITFPDVNPHTEGVAFAALDVSRNDPPAVVSFFGANGSIVFRPLADSTFPSSTPNPLLGPAAQGDWFTLSAGIDSITPSGAPLGPIKGILIETSIFVFNPVGGVAAIDNVRVLIENVATNTLVAGTVNATAIPGSPTVIDALSHDQFPAGDNVAITFLGQPSLGTAQIGGGGITYTPRSNAHGNDSFSYTIGDSQGNSAQGVVNVLVNTPPSAPTITVSVPHGQTGSFSSQITVPADADGDPLTLSHDQDGNSGTVTIHGDGSFTYQRTDGGVVSTDSFTYRVSDGFTSTVGTVNLVPDTQPPADPVNDLVPLVHGYVGPKTVNVLANDPYPHDTSDMPLGFDGDPLRVVVVGKPTNGDVIVNPDNTITYTPHKRTINPDGSISITLVPDPGGLVVDDSFSYALIDTVYNVSSNLATVHLIPANQVPAAPANFNLLFGHLSFGHAIRIDPFAGAAFDPQVSGSDATATDPATGAPITPAPLTDADGDPLHLGGAQGATGGQVQVVSPTEILYTPSSSLSATTVDDTFTYTVADPYASSAPATIHIHWLNDPPQLVPAHPAQPFDFNPALEVWKPSPASDDTAETIAGDQITGDLHTINYWFTSDLAFTNGPVSVDQAHGVLHDIVDPNGAVPFARLLTSPTPADGATGQLVDFNPNGSFRFRSIIPKGTYTFTFAASDGLSTTDPITVHIYVGAAIDTGTFNYSFDIADAGLFQGNGHLIGGFALNGFPSRVFAIGPMRVERGSLTVDQSSLVVIPGTGIQGGASFLPLNPYFTDPSHPPLVLSPNEALPTGQVTFYRQIWDGVVPAPPTRVVINVTATKANSFTSSTGHPVSASIDPSGPGTLKISASLPGSVTSPAPFGFPPGTSSRDFPEGFFSFEMSGLHAGEHMAVAITLPMGETVTSYWKYTNFLNSDGSWTTEWNPFTFDPITGTGAETHSDNPSIPPNEVILHLVDGGRGDDNRLPGVIRDPGGPLVMSSQSPEERYVTALYHKLLNRDPETAGLQGWANWLAAGATRFDVESRIYNSPEHRGIQVDQYYSHYLHRAADPGGRASWVNLLLSGTSETAVQQGFLTSPEYVSAHPNVYAFVRGLYEDVYGYAPDHPGAAYWVKKLGTDPSGDDQAFAAGAFLTSTVTNGNQVNAFYASFLGRAVDATGMSGWLAVLRRRFASPEQVADSILVSDEFWQRALAGIA
jgi:hypothetical protein